MRATLAPPSEIHSSFCAVLSSRETGTQSEGTRRGRTQRSVTFLLLTDQNLKVFLHFIRSALVVGSGTFGSYGGRQTVETDDRTELRIREKSKFRRSTWFFTFSC